MGHAGPHRLARAVPARALPLPMAGGGWRCPTCSRSASRRSGTASAGRPRDRVNRSDLLADLKRETKRAAPLAVQRMLVRGPRRHRLGRRDPAQCGLMSASDRGLGDPRPAPRRAQRPPFSVWMALAPRDAGQTAWTRRSSGSATRTYPLCPDAARGLRVDRRLAVAKARDARRQTRGRASCRRANCRAARTPIPPRLWKSRRAGVRRDIRWADGCHPAFRAGMIFMPSCANARAAEGRAGARRPDRRRQVRLDVPGAGARTPASGARHLKTCRRMRCAPNPPCRQLAQTITRAASLDEAARFGARHLGEDWQALVRHPAVDVVVECTGAPVRAVNTSLAAFAAGKPRRQRHRQADAFCEVRCWRSTRTGGGRRVPTRSRSATNRR